MASAHSSNGQLLLWDLWGCLHSKDVVKERSIQGMGGFWRTKPLSGWPLVRLRHAAPECLAGAVGRFTAADASQEF